MDEESTSKQEESSRAKGAAETSENKEEKAKTGGTAKKATARKRATSKKTTSKAKGNPFVDLYREHVEALGAVQQDATEKISSSTDEYYEAIRALAEEAEAQNPWPAYLADTVRSYQANDPVLLQQANRRLASHLSNAQPRLFQDYAGAVQRYVEALQELGHEVQEELVEQAAMYVSSVRSAIAEADAADLDPSAAAVLTHSLVLNAALVERERAEA